MGGKGKGGKGEGEVAPPFLKFLDSPAPGLYNKRNTYFFEIPFDQIIDDLDVRQLQLAVDVLCGWAKTWQLSMSVNKCCVLNMADRHVMLL